VVLMPPPAISQDDLTRLVAITAESIRAAVSSAYAEDEPTRLEGRRRAAPDSAHGAAA
jgi:hypothetical protein